MQRVINFYRVSEPYGEFSNFADFEITIDGKSCKSTERWFQAMKFVGTEHEAEILRAPSSRQSADMGRERSRPLRADWNTVLDFGHVLDGDKLRTTWKRFVGEPMLTKDYVMLVAVRAKFTQHAKLAELLLSTGGALLVEHTVNDSYWGDGGDGSGKNMLGKILMLVRDELREQQLWQEILEAQYDAGC